MTPPPSPRPGPYSSLSAIEDAFSTWPSVSLGESPLWDGVLGRLVWVDVVVGTVFEAVGGAVAVRDLGRAVMAVALAQGNELCVIHQNAIALPGEMARAPADEPHLAPELRFNDAGCDPAGRLWIGTTRLDGADGGGSLGRVEADGSFRPMVDALTLPNGIGWSPAGDRLYLADSGKGAIFQATFDAKHGEIESLRPFARPQYGTPDGLCVCADGSLWVALWGGGRVCRFDRDGRLADEIVLPVSQPTSCAVDGEGNVFVTTAAYGLGSEALALELLAGRVLRLPKAGPAGLEPMRVAL